VLLTFNAISSTGDLLLHSSVGTADTLSQVMSSENELAQFLNCTRTLSNADLEAATWHPLTAILTDQDCPAGAV